MESSLDFHTAKALLDWQVELGATEAILDAPVNRYEVPEKQVKPAEQQTQTAAPAAAPKVDPVAVATQMAKQVDDLGQLKAAIAQFEHCALKRGARNLVFGEGNPNARIMIIGDAPGRDEDRVGKPFVGRAGQLLDKMLAAIDLDRDMDRASETNHEAVYVAHILPWRPPQNRDPQAADIAMIMPFVRRHVELIAPDIIILMGNSACQGVLGKRGITRMRGTWTEALGRPVLPMLDPDALLRNQQLKRDAWADLLALKAKLMSLD